MAKKAALLRSVGPPSSPTPAAPPARTVTINTPEATQLLDTLDPPASGDPKLAEPSTQARWNAAVGCKTSEVALTLLAQIVNLDFPSDPGAAHDAKINRALMTAAATLAELRPATAIQSLLAVQMIGAQRAAMSYLHRAVTPGQPVEIVDHQVNRAIRLMHLFTEQVETMMKLQGKSSQQRVVVEHVTIAAGGQAIVGTVIPGGGGRWR